MNLGEHAQRNVYLVGSPYNKDYSILGFILGYPNFGKLPHLQLSKHPRG